MEHVDNDQQVLKRSSAGTPKLLRTFAVHTLTVQRSQLRAIDKKAAAC
jgi:hypothetical protein